MNRYQSSTYSLHPPPLHHVAAAVIPVRLMPRPLPSHEIPPSRAPKAATSRAHGITVGPSASPEVSGRPSVLATASAAVFVLLPVAVIWALSFLHLKASMLAICLQI